METKYPIDESYEEPPRRRFSRKALWLIIGGSVGVVVALAVGLGVGLTIGRNGSGGDSGDSANPAQPAFSATPSAGPSNLWQPPVNASWQIVLQNPILLDTNATSIEPNVSVYDIDMFTNSRDTIDTLHRLGKKVICYFSAGSYEPNRPDSGNFTDADKGHGLDGWPGEYWLNLSSTNVRNIMTRRIQYAAAKGCDAIDPDNMDAYANNGGGIGLTQQDSIDYVNFLSSVALPLNLSMGLKNANAIIPSVLNITQFSVNEQCVQYSECALFAPYVEANKPVFNIEYPKGIPNVDASTVSEICSRTGKSAGAQGFSTVIKRMSLDGWVEYCDASVQETATLSS